MQHDVDIAREQCEVGPYGSAHTTLDAVAIHGFAEHTTGGQADARTGASRHPRMVPARGKEISHGRGKVLAALTVHALIIGMFAQPSIALCEQTQGRLKPVSVEC